MADETQEIQEQTHTTEEITPQEQGIQFEDILPWGTVGGDTGLTSRLKLKRNFEKIKAWIDVIGSGNSLQGKFLSKEYDDEAAGIIGFLKGFWVKAKGLFGIDEEGNATVNDLTVKGATTLAHVWADIIRSGNFSGYGIGDTGWELTNSVEGSGKSQLTVDIIQARMKIIATALEVRKWYGVGGNFVASPSAGTIWKVAYYDGEGEELGWKTVTVPWRGGGRLLMGIANGVRRLLGRQKRVSRELTADERLRVRRIRCYLYSDDGTTMTQGNISIGSQMRCQTFNTASMKETADGYIADHLRTSYWWRVVSNIGSEPVAEDDGRIHDYVDFDVQTGPDGQDDPNVADTGSDWPQPGDQMVEFGHRTDTDRQHVITLETVGADAPALKEYQGINSFSLDGKRKTMISPRGGSEIYATKFVIQTEYDEVRVPADRGLWIDIPTDGNGQRRCYYYDRVAHNGSLWLCVIQEYKTVYADADGNEISVEQYDALPVEQQKRYRQKRVKNYTTVEPSEQAVGIWQKEVYTQIPARLVLSRKLVPVDCESDGKASEAVSMEIEARLMVTNLECEGVSLELSASSGNIRLSQDGKRIEVGYAKGDSVTGTDVTVTATGTLLGQQYSASDSLSIYPVRKGEEGASAYEVTCSTNSFILNQQEDEPYEIQTSGAETTIDVKRNGEQQAWRIVSVAYVVDVYNGSATNGYNEILTSWSDTAGIGAKTVTVTYVKNNIKQAHLLVTVEYGNSQQRTLRILIACNLLGTWKQKVIGDAENVWAEKTKYTYTDDDGVSRTMTIQDFYAHYERSSEAMSEEFKSVKQSLDTNTNTMNTLSTNVAEYKRSADAMTEQWGEFQGEVEDAKEAMSQAKNAMDDAVDKYDTLDGKIKDAQDAADDAATKAGTAITTSTKSATGVEILTGKFENPQYNDDGSLKSVGKLSALSGYVQTDEFAKIFSRIILNDPTEKETIEGYVQTKAESVSLGVVSTKIGENNEEIKQRTGIDITRGLIRLNNKTVIEGSLNVVDDGAGFSLIGSTGTTNITRKSVGTYEEWQQQTTATKVANGSAEGSVGAENAQFIIEIPFTIDMPGTVVFRGQTINFAKSSGSVLQKPQRGTVEYEVDGDSITEWSTLSDNPGSCSKVLNSAGSHTLTITVTAYDIASAGWSWAYNEERVAECYFSCLIDYPTANLVQIGYDGIAMNYGTNKNIYLAAENTTFRYGNIGFRVDSTGVWVASKLNDSGGLLWTQFIKPDDSGGVSVSWNNISDKPKYVFAVKIGSKKKEAESTSGSTLEFTLEDIGAMAKTEKFGKSLALSSDSKKLLLKDQDGTQLSEVDMPSLSGDYIPLSGSSAITGNLVPASGSSCSLGLIGYPWSAVIVKDIYCTNQFHFFKGILQAKTLAVDWDATGHPLKFGNSIVSLEGHTHSNYGTGLYLDSTNNKLYLRNGDTNLGDGVTLPSGGSGGGISSIVAEAGDYIDSVGTPSVSASTVNGITTLTFNYLKGATGKSIEYQWSGTYLRLRQEGGAWGSYVNLKGADGTNGTNGTNGKSLEFNWSGTSLGVRREGDSSYTYQDLAADTSNCVKTNTTNMQVLLGKLVVSNSSNAEVAVCRNINASNDRISLHWSASNYRGLYDDGASRWVLRFDGSNTYMEGGNVKAVSGSFIDGSDIRRKDVLAYLSPDISKIAELPIIRFVWKDLDDKKEHLGTIAQSVMTVMPELVYEGDSLGLDYGALGVVSAITAAREIVALKKEVEAKDAMIKNLEQDLADERERRDNIEQRLKRVEELLWEIIENREN